MAADFQIIDDQLLHAEARELLDAWTKLYTLDDRGNPPALSPLGAQLLNGSDATDSLQNLVKDAQSPRAPVLAPHLQDCAEATRAREAMDRRGANGEPPGWTDAGGDSPEARSSGGEPRAPWVRGGVDANIPLTHTAQRDLWLHQFPANCSSSSQRFLIAPWIFFGGHGFGSQLHIMTECIERVQRLRQDEVVQVGPNASMGDTRNGSGSRGQGKWSLCENVMEAALSDSVAVQPGMRCFSDRELVPGKWGEPWVLTDHRHWYGNQPQTFSKISWWRAQAIRFLLRWPSLYLCHLTNIARHKAFGRDAAIRIMEAFSAEAVAEDSLSSFVSALASPSFDNRMVNETLLHDGDKIKLGKAESVATWMKAAMLLRVHDPSLHRMWISTDTQEVMDIAKQYRHWHAYWFEDEPKWDPKSESQKRTETRDLRASVESSLVNLMLAAECDYSVTTLDSNWNRVIHFMRITGRRLGFPAVFEMDVINGGFKGVVKTLGRIGKQRDRDDDEEGHPLEIGEPTDVKHVAHVTFDRFKGFLGLPEDIEGELPCRAPSAGRSVFGVQPELLQCSQDEFGNSVPNILLQLQALLYVKKGLQTEGIFRVAAENDHEDEIRDQVNMGLVPQSINVHALAGLIKAWFRELPQGLLDSLPVEVVAACETEEQMLALVAELPETQSMLLDWVVGLMADVVQFEERNKMNARNIAMVFAPNMTQVLDPIMGLRHAVKVMDLLRVLIERKQQEPLREGGSAALKAFVYCTQPPTIEIFEEPRQRSKERGGEAGEGAGEAEVGEGEGADKDELLARMGGEGEEAELDARGGEEGDVVMGEDGGAEGNGGEGRGAAAGQVNGSEGRREGDRVGEAEDAGMPAGEAGEAGLNRSSISSGSPFDASSSSLPGWSPQDSQLSQASQLSQDESHSLSLSHLPRIASDSPVHPSSGLAGTVDPKELSRRVASGPLQVSAAAAERWRKRRDPKPAPHHTRMASHDGPVGRDVLPSPGFFRSGKNAPQSDPTAKERRASRIGVPTKMFFRRNLSEGGPAFGRDWDAERRKIAAEDAGAAGGPGGRGGLDGGDVAEGREGEGEDEVGAGEMELRGAEEGVGSGPSVEGQQRAGLPGARGAKKLLHKFGTGLKVVTPGGASGGGSSGESSSPRGQLLRRSFSSKGSGLGPAADKVSAAAGSVSTGGVPPPVPDRPSRVLPPTPRMGSMLEKPVRNVEKATRGVGKLARSFSGNIDGHWGAIKREMGLAVRGKGRSSFSGNAAGPVSSAPGGVDMTGAGGLGVGRSDGGGAERPWEACEQVGEGREILDGVMEHGAEVTVEAVDAVDAIGTVDVGMDLGLMGRDGGGGDAAVDMEGGEMAVDVVVCTTPGGREEGGCGSDEDVTMEGAEEGRSKKLGDDDDCGDVGKGSWEGESGEYDFGYGAVGTW
ncbi:unnamed protein product [Closterium sp. Yama58-4]|nr:unnamed protein product [Closterium sp. Yama58-4]